MIKDGYAIVINPGLPSVNWQQLGFTMYLQDRNSSGHEALLAKRNELLGKMRQSPILKDVRPSGLKMRRS